MKIAISSTGKDLDSNVDPRFGRCAYFILVDPDTMEYEVFENQSAMLGGGAGIQSAQFVASKGAEVVITGNCGPNAVRTLEAAGIKIITGYSGTVRQAIEDFKTGKLKTTHTPTVEEHFGIKQIPSRGSELAELKEQAALLRRQLEMIERRISQLGRGTMPVQEQKKSGQLRIAVPVDRGLISQHFGHAELFLIAEVEDGEIKRTETKTPPPHEPGIIPKWMNELGVDVIITGGMGRRALSLFDEYGIKVVVGAPQIDPIDAIKEYLKGTLTTGENVCAH
jgi:predicted Fe-Mo cluster-binding NifX family protein